jgi:hypothetical protein
MMTSGKGRRNGILITNDKAILNTFYSSDDNNNSNTNNNGSNNGNNNGNNNGKQQW